MVDTMKMILWRRVFEVYLREETKEIRGSNYLD